MEEEADGRRNAHFAQRRGQRHKMIVMHPDEIIGLQQGLQPGRKALVHMTVAAFELPVEDCKIKPVVQDWPERPVGIAGIETIVISLVHVDLHKLDRLCFLLLKRAECALFGDLAAPAEPKSAGACQRIDQSHSEPPALPVSFIGPTRFDTTTSRPMAFVSFSD